MHIIAPRMHTIAPNAAIPTVLMLPPPNMHPSKVMFRDGTAITVAAAPGEAIAIPQPFVTDLLLFNWTRVNQ